MEFEEMMRKLGFDNKSEVNADIEEMNMALGQSITIIRNTYDKMLHEGFNEEQSFKFATDFFFKILDMGK